MDKIELRTVIDMNGNVHFPEEFRQYYGKHAKIMVTLTDKQSLPRRSPGSAKGKLRIVSEDEKHLEDFKVYLE